jgi:hypothetical protein
MLNRRRRIEGRQRQSAGFAAVGMTARAVLFDERAVGIR